MNSIWFELTLLPECAIGAADTENMTKGFEGRGSIGPATFIPVDSTHPIGTLISTRRSVPASLGGRAFCTIIFVCFLISPGCGAVGTGLSSGPLLADKCTPRSRSKKRVDRREGRSAPGGHSKPEDDLALNESMSPLTQSARMPEGSNRMKKNRGQRRTGSSRERLGEDT